MDRWKPLNLAFLADYHVLPFTQAEDGESSYQLTLHFFDHLLQENKTGVAVCENPEVSPQDTLSIPVTCTTTDVTVMLPHEAKLQTVRHLGKNQTDDTNTVKCSICCGPTKHLWCFGQTACAVSMSALQLLAELK